tara:strand:+ start:45973 stop:46326 length:354 start_codon:yes stop_codon:yes gene_type:complete
MNNLKSLALTVLSALTASNNDYAAISHAVFLLPKDDHGKITSFIKCHDSFIGADSEDALDEYMLSMLVACALSRKSSADDMKNLQDYLSLYVCEDDPINTNEWNWLVNSLFSPSTAH